MSEVLRILSLPIKNNNIPDMTKFFKTPNGTMNLRPIQSEILYTAQEAQGLLGLVGVGEGKTLSSFLLPHVLSKKGTSLLIIPANMRAQCLKDWQTYEEHFFLPKRVELRSYEEISTSPNLLKAIAPDAIICDEVHRLKNKKSQSGEKSGSMKTGLFFMKIGLFYLPLAIALAMSTIKQRVLAKPGRRHCGCC